MSSEIPLLVGINAHAPCCAGDYLFGLREVGGVEVLHLFLRELLQLLLSELGDLILRLVRALFDAELLQDGARGRRLLHHEGEGAGFVDSENDLQGVACHWTREGVELVDEFADVDSRRSERGTDRRRRRCCPCGY